MDYVALPKIELHAHLTGSISRQCLHEIWQGKKAAGQTDLEDPLVVMPDGKHDYDLNTFFPLFTKYIYNLVTDAEAVSYSTRSVLADFAADGVVYLELRTTPRANGHLSKQEYLTTVLSAIKDFEAQSTSRLRTRVILSIDRRNTLSEAMETVSLATSLRPKGVVGVDLGGDPAQKPNGEISVFTPAIETARDAGLKLTVHFAEAESSSCAAELRTLLSWRPERLGHVIHVGEEVRREIRERQMGLELCLSCNVAAGMVKGGFATHHFGEWWAERATVSLGTDDVGVFGSPLSSEYELVARHFKLERDEICELARKGIDLIFGGEEEKQRLRGLMWT